VWKYYIFRLAHLLLGRMPVQVNYGIARLAGDTAYYFRSSTRAAVIDNMRHVMGPEASEREVRRAAREAFRNVARYYADLVQIPHLNIERFARERLTLDGLEYVVDARDSGRGAIVFGAHAGNPEMSVQGLAADGVYFFALAEHIKPKALLDFTNKLRMSHGHTYRELSVGGLRETVRRLKQGGLIAILVDRDTTNSGVPMEFFGETRKIPTGAVELALRTGADLVFATSERLPGYRFRATISPPLDLVRTGNFDADVRANTRLIVELLECQLRADPGQWAVLERAWPEKGGEHQS
jgi:phosphatidylinositol dimannoside acyltransferase